MDPLRRLLRPAGGGLYTVSTGRSEQESLQQRLYGVENAEGVEAAWHNVLEGLGEARAAVLGIPSDTGAGIVRGAAWGPQGLRQAWLGRPAGQGPQAFASLVDAGDVRVVPQLLSDDMLSEAQLNATREALYPDLSAADRASFPASPLSIAERALDLMLTRNPNLRLLVLGGDHSVAWPVVAALTKHLRRPWGIVHFDAHTDLLPTRLGVKYCFATWAFHAAQLIGGPRLVQIGIRASGRDRGHWESTQGVRQFWASEVNAQPVATTISQVVEHLRAQGVEQLYVSNDIDGTDAGHAPATGTPEPAGLSPELVLGLIEALGREFEVVAADLVEVAPPIGDPAGARATCELGVSYLLASVAAML